MAVTGAELFEHRAAVGNIAASADPPDAIDQFRIGIVLSASACVQEWVIFGIGAPSASGVKPRDGCRERIQPLRRRNTVVVQERKQLGTAALDAAIAGPRSTAPSAVLDHDYLVGAASLTADCCIEFREIP